jgi:hypothetical protein
MISLTFLLNYFSNQDPEDNSNMGIVKTILGVHCKIAPFWIRVMNYLKVLIVVILIYFTFFAKVGTSYIDANKQNTDTSLPVYCNTKEKATVFAYRYSNHIVIFWSVEIISVFISIFILGTIKSWLEQEAYIYDPENLKSSYVVRLMFRSFGP